jgi:hypothetical protein
MKQLGPRKTLPRSPCTFQQGGGMLRASCEVASFLTCHLALYTPYILCIVGQIYGAQTVRYSILRSWMTGMTSCEQLLNSTRIASLMTVPRHISSITRSFLFLSTLAHVSVLDNRSVLFPFPLNLLVTPRTVRIQRNVVYAHPPSTNLLIDQP